ncbi:MAG: hypothetical protein ABIP94_01850, partial [Planctomycetota bacterium]
AWIAEADGDPAAQLCRMRILLRAGAIEEARDDAMVAVQESVARDQALQDVVQICQEAATELEAGAVEGVRLMAQQFHSLQTSDGTNGGR